MKTKILPTLSLIFLIPIVMPAQGVWTAKTGFAGKPRMNATGFAIGNKAYLGTGCNPDTAYADFWEYDPVSDIWTQKADFGGGPRAYAVGFAIGADGYIGFGGEAQNSSSLIAHNDLWKYNSVTNTWAQMTSCGGVGKGHHGNPVAFVLNSEAYVGTGNDPQDNYTSDFWKYNPASNSWTQTAACPMGNCGGAGFAIGSKGYIGGGYNFMAGEFWQYDAGSNSWSQKATNTNLGYMIFSAGFSLGSKGYFVGGTDLWMATPIVLEWDQATDTWTTLTNLPGNGIFGAVTWAINGKAYLATGSDQQNMHNEVWEFDPQTNGIAENNISDQITISTLGNGQFSINSNDLRMSQLEIYSIKGEKVLSLSQRSGNQTDLDLSGKMGGVYIIKIKTDRGFATKKVMMK